MKSFFGSIILTLFAAVAVAQEHAYINYTTADGLPSNKVYAMLQDKQGYMWFATDKGVARFDGYEFETFMVEDGVYTYTVQEICKGGKEFTLSGSITVLR